MATSKSEFEKAFRLLSQFERQLIPAEDFSWGYITERVVPSKPTLWRNVEFRDEFNRVAKLVKGYKEGSALYSVESSKQSILEATNAALRQEVESLKEQLNQERERLAYAAVVARRNNVDPLAFEEESPLLGAIGRYKKAKRSN